MSSNSYKKTKQKQQQQYQRRRTLSGITMTLLASAVAFTGNATSSAFAFSSPQTTNRNHESIGRKTNHRTSDDKWNLLIYDDAINTREKVARVLVQVAGRSNSEAFQTMNKAHSTGVAFVDTHLRFEIAEAYNEELQKQGLITEIVPVSDQCPENIVGGDWQ